MKKSLSRIAIAGLLLLVCLPAGAVTIVTTSGTGNDWASNFGSGFSNGMTFTDGTLTATIRAYSNTNSNGTFARAQVGRYSNGLGVCNASEGTGCGSPAHQIDNGSSIPNFSSVDLVLITFNQAVRVQSVGLTPSGSGTPTPIDSDIRYLIGSASYSDLNSSILSLTGPNILNDATNGSIFGSLLTNTTTTAALNTLRTATLNTGLINYLVIMPGGIDSNLDYFKLTNIITFDTTTNEGGVPEPSTYAMLGCGLVALGYFRRFRKN